MLTRTSLERKEVSLPFSGHKDMAIGRAAKKLVCLGPMELEALAIIAQPAVHHIGRSPRWRLEQQWRPKRRNSLGGGVLGRQFGLGFNHHTAATSVDRKQPWKSDAA